MDGATLPGGTLTAFLAMLLLRAAWHKAQAFPETTGLIASYGIVPEGREALAARGVIALEGLLLVALVLPPVRSLGAAGTAALLLGYAAAMALVLRRGQRRIDCGCGEPPQVVSALTIARNAVLALLALTVAALPAGASSGAGAALSIAGGLTLWCLYAIVEGLLANAGHIRLAADRP